ncbi:MAG TPA: UTP--glucose-1-phosphate uridylyltransferase GalU [Rhodocyclaceae bacterium]|nr:UTP--glucose-1-phosphate uridylyltransferase GalU [Rhodocyclaceae bacterium]HMV53023.1 UTP--glucose-1-phosphate uridylyltransferase GalU [Rhodocyclaceae bacterium]HMZ83364.1 UTP--glucose-1-phosphate uridylyltransferase GalU [Rhodocyclaceae bacterium]HNA03546.1 UTP--glucose-1-phosphate uridylyltransferase GalU [Rhodocyclaceae bacterium]HNB78612.1 UTP--glucose-1-phosphate uridylyltransferase GalU [Rhodocyclaceae bacterium]
MKKIRKAVFPVAGLGSRFLPATKANPKEMLPVVDKPLIQYAVEEAVAAGVTDMIFITGRTKRSIADHFDKAYELEHELDMKNKHDLLKLCETVPKHVNCIYLRQAEPLGLGHAVLCAAPIVNDEPFAVLLADDLIDAEPPALKQMVDVYNYHRCSVLGTMNVPREQTRQYGIVSTLTQEGRVQRMTGIVEKPAPEKAPTTQAVVGRYVLTPQIFEHLRNVQPGAGGEIQLTDAIASLLKEEAVLAYQFEGTRYDCGSKLGYMQAQVAFGLKHPDVGAEFAAYLKQMNEKAAG